VKLYESLEALDLLTHEWYHIPPMKRARSKATAVVIGNNVYIVGGKDDWGLALSSVEVFNWKTNTWSEIPRMHQERYSASVVVVQDSIVVTGGHENEFSSLKSTEVYDTKSQQWRLAADMPTARGSCGVVVLRDRYVVVAGGSVHHLLYDSILRSVQVLDIVGNVWHHLPGLTTERSGLGLSVVGNHVYAIGGYNHNHKDKNLRSVERLTLPTEDPTCAPPPDVKELQTELMLLKRDLWDLEAENQEQVRKLTAYSEEKRNLEVDNQEQIRNLVASNEEQRNLEKNNQQQIRKLTTSVEKEAKSHRQLAAENKRLMETGMYACNKVGHVSYSARLIRTNRS